MEKTITFHELRFLFELLKKKQEELQERIDRLGIEDVKENTKFQKTIESIKKQIIPEPVRFKDPVIVKHEPKVITEGGGTGGTRKVMEVEVSFPFTGSAELFGFRPDEINRRGTLVYLPDGNNVTINVHTTFLDKVKVLSAAHQKMELTKEIINIANNHIGPWGIKLEEDIDEKLRQKRREIIEFYS